MKRVAAVLVVLIIAVAADAVSGGAQQHGEYWWSHIPGFLALFGLTGCLAIIALAKYVLGPWLQRDENYYDRTPG
jgi:hypothetical protein